MNSPLVSIGFPVFNGGESVGRALDSILSQDFEDFELVICDNASTDETRAVCESYAARDRRIRYNRNETNIGASPNHNRVFELSRARYFTWTAHDVEMLPGMLSRCTATLRETAPSTVLVYPLCELVDPTGATIVNSMPSIASNDPRPHRRLMAVIRHIWYVTQHYGLFVADALRNTRLNGSYASSDYVLTAEVAMLGEIRELPEVLLRRRINPTSGTAAVVHSQAAWAAWLDPNMNNRGTFLPLRERLAWEYIKSSWYLPLRPMDKLSCMVAAPVVHYGKILLEETPPSWRQNLKLLFDL